MVRSHHRKTKTNILLSITTYRNKSQDTKDGREYTQINDPFENPETSHCPSIKEEFRIHPDHKVLEKQANIKQVARHN